MIDPSAYSDSQVAAFGKLPWAGDFLRVGHLPGSEALLSWLEQGVGAAASRGQQWKTEFDQAAQKGFLLNMGSGGLLAGVLSSSHDQVGRRFPFSIYAGIDGQALLPGPHAAPLLLGEFLHAADSTIRELEVAQTDHVRAVGELRAPQVDSLSNHVMAFDAWARSADLRSAGQAIFGADWREQLAGAVCVVLQCAEPLGRRESPETRLAIRFPVGTGLAGAAAFWIQVVRAAMNWTTTIPSAVWSFDPIGAAVTVFLGKLDARSFADLWESHPQSETLSDLVFGGRFGVQQLGELRPDIANLMLQENSSVEQLLSALR